MNAACGPTALEPVWRVAGFALGAVTAAMGEKAAFACTAAVEEVIDEHYAAQIAALKDKDPALKATVEDFRADEAAHRDDGSDAGRRTGAGLQAAQRDHQGRLPLGDKVVGTNLDCHSRESGNPFLRRHLSWPWMPAFAGMTKGLTAPARYPSTDNPPSFRADNSAETCAHVRAVRSPWADAAGCADASWPGWACARPWSGCRGCRR